MEYWDGKLNWLTPKDMGQMEGRYIGHTPRTISESGLQNSSARLVPANSVILSTRAPIGHLAINSAPMAFNQGCRGLVPSQVLDTNYLYYFLFCNKSALDALGTGATFKELSSGALKGFKIPLPPLEEQQRIVAILDEAFDGLDRARANAEANLQSARELFDSYLANIFRSEDWQENTLDEISENLDRIRVPITKRDRIAGEFPYYGASGIVDYVADFLFNEDLLLISEDGANLLARTYPIAFSISGKSWVNNHAHVLRFPNLNTQEYVRLYLNSIDLEPFVSGMAQPKLNQAQLNRIPIPMPDEDSQADIVSKAQQLSAEIEDLEQRYKLTIQDLDDLRQSLLQKAFAGELT